MRKHIDHQIPRILESWRTLNCLVCMKPTADNRLIAEGKFCVVLIRENCGVNAVGEVISGSI